MCMHVHVCTHMCMYVHVRRCVQHQLHSTNYVVRKHLCENSSLVHTRCTHASQCSLGSEVSPCVVDTVHLRHVHTSMFVFEGQNDLWLLVYIQWLRVSQDPLTFHFRQFYNPSLSGKICVLIAVIPVSA